MSNNPIRTSEAKDHVGETVTVRGWLYNLRKSGKIVFPIVRDGSGMMECVAAKSALPEEVFAYLKSLTQESSKAIHGTVRADPRAPGCTTKRTSWHSGRCIASGQCFAPRNRKPVGI